MSTVSNIYVFRDLNPLSVDQGVIVQVLRKWFVLRDVCGERSLHLLLCDSMGHRCETIIEPYLVVGFDEILIVGSVFHIMRFSLIKKICSCPPSHINFMIMFHSQSAVLSTVAPVFSTCLYDVIEISVIKQKSYHIDPVLFDVFGGLWIINNFLLLRMAMGVSEIRVVLRGQDYYDFKCCIDVTWRCGGSFFVVLQLFRAVLSNGEVVLTSYKNVSNLITDQTDPGVLYFKSRLTRLMLAPLVNS